MFSILLLSWPPVAALFPSLTNRSFTLLHNQCSVFSYPSSSQCSVSLCSNPPLYNALCRLPSSSQCSVSLFSNPLFTMPCVVYPPLHDALCRSPFSSRCPVSFTLLHNALCRCAATPAAATATTTAAAAQQKPAAATQPAARPPAQRKQGGRRRLSPTGHRCATRSTHSAHSSSTTPTTPYHRS